MNYLFKSNEIYATDPTRSDDFFVDLIDHIFNSRNSSPENGFVYMTVYLISEMESGNVEKYEIITDEKRLNFLDRISQQYLNSCYWVLFDLNTGGNRVIFTFQEKQLIQLLITVNAHNSLLFVDDGIDIIPQLNIKLDQSWNMYVSMRTYCHNYHLTNVHPFQLESYRLLKGFINEAVSPQEATRWFKRFWIYLATCRSLLQRVDNSQDLINMNPNLLDLFEENVTHIIEDHNLGERLFPNQDQHHFYVNLKHYMTQYNDIIERGLIRIKEL